jgi:hypothetical protein
MSGKDLSVLSAPSRRDVRGSTSFSAEAFDNVACSMMT